MNNDGALRALADHSRQLGNARSVPLWAIALLTIAFIVVGGLAVAWAAVGMAALTIWTAYCLPRSGPRLPLPRDALQSTGERAENDRREPAWRQMLDILPDAAVMLDEERRVLAANAKVADVQVVTIGGSVAQLRNPGLLAAVETAMATGAPQPFDMRVLLPVERHYSGTATPLHLVEPDAPSLLIVLRDRTEIERLAEMRADFVANASHELRTPLAALKGFIETLQGAAKDDRQAQAQFLTIMQAQADRMSRLIDDLLSLSRIEMREHVPPTASVDLAAVAREAVISLQPLAATAAITLQVQLSAGPHLVIGERDELAQIAQNLVQNAVKYGRVGGKIEVTVRRDGDDVILAVADDGIGIAPQHLPRLTERFYRVSAKESRERGGTGLGLAIVKHIARRHRGELKIASMPGEGSTFSVVLPAAP